MRSVSVSEKCQQVDSNAIAMEQLHGFEWEAISYLKSFDETDCTKAEESGKVCFSVAGVERYFQPADSTSWGLLWMLARCFEGLDELKMLVDELRSNLDYEKSMKLAGKAMAVASLIREVGMALDGF